MLNGIAPAISERLTRSVASQQLVGFWHSFSVEGKSIDWSVIGGGLSRAVGRRARQGSH
jgi:hypothetical protein